MCKQLLYGHFKGYRNRWEYVLFAGFDRFAKGFVEPAPPLSVALVEEVRVGSPIHPELRAWLAVAGLRVKRDQRCFTP